MVDDVDFAAGCYLHTSVNLEVGALAETGRTPFKLLQSLAGRRLEVLDRLALLIIDGNRLVIRTEQATSGMLKENHPRKGSPPW